MSTMKTKVYQVRELASDWLLFGEKQTNDRFDSCFDRDFGDLFSSTSSSSLLLLFIFIFNCERLVFRLIM